MRGIGPFLCAEARRTGPLPLPATQIVGEASVRGIGPSLCAEARRAGPRPLPATQIVGKASVRGIGPLFALAHVAGCLAGGFGLWFRL